MQFASPVRSATFPAELDGAKHQTAQAVAVCRPTQSPSQTEAYAVPLWVQLAAAAVAAAAVVVAGV